ncbi:MAG: hypothetical protein IIA45_00070 [Bacteroidetes bacterium]|nr:hypothetical protein [Bacteroidota bacterium]
MKSVIQVLSFLLCILIMESCVRCDGSIGNGDFTLDCADAFIEKSKESGFSYVNNSGKIIIYTFLSEETYVYEEKNWCDDYSIENHILIFENQQGGDKMTFHFRADVWGQGQVLLDAEWKGWLLSVYYCDYHGQDMDDYNYNDVKNSVTLNNNVFEDVYYIHSYQIDTFDILYFQLEKGFIGAEFASGTVLSLIE